AQSQLPGAPRRASGQCGGCARRRGHFRMWRGEAERSWRFSGDCRRANDALSSSLGTSARLGGTTRPDSPCAPPAMKTQRVLFLVLLVFAITLAIVVGWRMSAEAMAVVIGVIAGVAASI